MQIADACKTELIISIQTLVYVLFTTPTSLRVFIIILQCYIYIYIYICGLSQHSQALHITSD
jgi:hypothetical protein